MVIDSKFRQVLERSAAKLGVDAGSLFDWAHALSPTDEVDVGIAGGLRDGGIEMAAWENGEPSFRITEQGQASVERLLSESPEARSLMARLKGN